MATLKFENDTPSKDDEKTYIISQDVKRSQMAKILNCALGSTTWYTTDKANVADNDWAYLNLDSEIETVKNVSAKHGWTVTISPEVPQATLANDWKTNPATERQLNYLRNLSVDLNPFENITKWFASELIDAAKNGQLGNILGAFYTDGSN